MTAAADLLVTNATVHTLGSPDRTHEAVAFRDGEIVGLGSAYDVEFLAGVETRTIDLDGRPLLPGFVDAHAHMVRLGQSLVHADLSTAGSLDACLDALRAAAGEDREWLLGFGYDETAWDVGRPPTRADLDAVSEDRPVAAVGVGGHVASLNSVALDRLEAALPDEGTRTEGGEPTGVLVAGGVAALEDAIAPTRAEARDLLAAARDRAHARGVTCVHDVITSPQAARASRDLAVAGDLDLRVRLNYCRSHLDAVRRAGLAPAHGSEFVRTGAIATAVDDGRDAWTGSPGELRELLDCAGDAGFQVAARAVGDEAIAATLDAFEDRSQESRERRHRIEHPGVLRNDAVERIAAAGVVAVLQPTGVRRAESVGHSGSRPGRERRRQPTRYRDLLDAGAHLALSGGVSLDPLAGVHRAVNAPDAGQRLSVTEALRAHTRGGAYAGFDEDRLGTIEVGKRADVVALERSPWEHPDGIADVGVALTVVDGEVVHDGRTE